MGSYLGSFNSFSGVFPEALYISTKTNKGQININGVNYEYNELVQKEMYDSFRDDNMSLSTYLNIG